MIELLQIKHKGMIILCGLGAFYLARGKDAILLNEIAGLRLSCMETEICKVGFPIASLEKYTDIIEEKGYGYIVYYFDAKTERLEMLKTKYGKKKNEIKAERNNCYICCSSTKRYKKHDKYIQAVANLYEQEKKDEREE